MLEIELLDERQASNMCLALNEQILGKIAVNACFNSVKHCDNALLVDVVNVAPFVFVKPATRYVFQFAFGSGTDHMRQRILAKLFFDTVADSGPTAQSHVARQEALKLMERESEALAELKQ